MGYVKSSSTASLVAGSSAGGLLLLSSVPYCERLSQAGHNSSGIVVSLLLIVSLPLVAQKSSRLIAELTGCHLGQSRRNARYRLFNQ